MSFLDRVIIAHNSQKSVGQYSITFYPVEAEKMPTQASIGSIAGRLRLIASLLRQDEQDPDRQIGANLCYKSTADWLLLHKDEWDKLNLVILALQPNFAIHALITDRENLSVVYDLDNAPACKKPAEVNGYFIPVPALADILTH